MASPPFSIAETTPADNDFANVYPLAERTFRDVVESWLLIEHNTSGTHDKVTLLDQAGNLTIAAGNIGIWNNAGVLKTRNGVGAITNIPMDASLLATLASPAFTGTPTAPTAAATTSTTQLATTAFVQQELTGSIALRGYIDGNILSNNGSDATNDIDIATGIARDGSNTTFLVASSALTKQLDANWVAGTKQGMRNSAAGIANGTYHIYRIGKADGTTDIYAVAGVAGTDPDTSSALSAVIAAIQAEPSGSLYIYARRLGSILREGGTIVPFIQIRNYFRRKTTILDVSATNPGTSAVTRTLSVPLGPKVEADIIVAGREFSGTSSFIIWVSDLEATDEVAAEYPTGPALTGQILVGSGGSRSWATSEQIWTNNSGQIRSRLSVSDGNKNLYISTKGWTDLRGTT